MTTCAGVTFCQANASDCSPSSARHRQLENAAGFARATAATRLRWCRTICLAATLGPADASVTKRAQHVTGSTERGRRLNMTRGSTSNRVATTRRTRHTGTTVLSVWRCAKSGDGHSLRSSLTSGLVRRPNSPWIASIRSATMSRATCGGQPDNSRPRTSDTDTPAENRP